MRHAVFGKKLSRDINARKALLNNLTSAILINGQVTTTLAKAKFAQSQVEKLVTNAKKNKLQKNRLLASSLTHGAFLKLINEIGPHFSGRSGGYTRIIKLAVRRGDAAKMARLEFVERPASPKLAKKDDKQKEKSKKAPKIKTERPKKKTKIVSEKKTSKKVNK